MEKKTEKDNMDAKLRIKDELRGYRVYIKRGTEKDNVCFLVHQYCNISIEGMSSNKVIVLVCSTCDH